MIATSFARAGRFVVALALAATPVFALADNADVCASPDEPYATAHPLGNTTVFACLQAGSKTIPQLATAGWEIVKVSPVAGAAGSIHHQLIVQSGDSIFRSGFEQP
ncbi:MAG: hypothetical protein ABIS07_18285 [Dokdonella sp.]